MSIAERATGVIFGAGNIGRGFIAQLFHESGINVLFVDVNPAALAALNRLGRYRIHIVGEGAGTVEITGVRGIDGYDRDAVADALAGCRVCATAVGASALAHVAPNLAAGLILRYARGGGPLNILVGENLHDAGDRLRELVGERLATASRDAIQATTGFVQAVVSRMVPLQTPEEDRPLDIRVEAYKRLPVDGLSIVHRLPSIVGVELVDNFEAHVERKLYTHNCAHATLGYLGYAKGITYAHEALVDPIVRETLESALAETSEALIRKHGFTREEQSAHVADLLRRFANAELADTCFRLGRDPLRKLAPDDRLVGAARLCECVGVQPKALATVIAAALRFDSPDDPSAVALQARIAREGLESVLLSVCGIRADEPLGRMVLGGG